MAKKTKSDKNDKSSSKTKLRSREKEVIKNNGIKMLLINMSEKDKFCHKCLFILPKQGMVVDFNNHLFCGFSCSNKED